MKDKNMNQDCVGKTGGGRDMGREEKEGTASNRHNKEEAKGGRK